MSRTVIALSICAGLWYSTGIARNIETAFFPVVERVTIFDPQHMPPPEFQFSWSGFAKKLRDCDYRGVRWYLGRREGRAAEIKFYFGDPPEVREKGLLYWSSMVIALDPDNVLTNSYADVYHQCPWLPWETRSRFFDSSELDFNQ